MKVLVLVVLLIMPDGTPDLDSRLVKSCPDGEFVNDMFTAMKEDGEILDWSVTCLMVNTKGLPNNV